MGKKDKIVTKVVKQRLYKYHFSKRKLILLFKNIENKKKKTKNKKKILLNPFNSIFTKSL